MNQFEHEFNHKCNYCDYIVHHTTLTKRAWIKLNKTRSNEIPVLCFSSFGSFTNPQWQRYTVRRSHLGSSNALQSLVLSSSGQENSLMLMLLLLLLLSTSATRGRVPQPAVEVVNDSQWHTAVNVLPPQKLVHGLCWVLQIITLDLSLEGCHLSYRQV